MVGIKFNLLVVILTYYLNWLGVMTSYMFTCSMILIYIGILLFSWNEPAAIIYWTTMTMLYRIPLIFAF